MIEIGNRCEVKANKNPSPAIKLRPFGLLEGFSKPLECMVDEELADYMEEAQLFLSSQCKFCTQLTAVQQIENFVAYEAVLPGKFVVQPWWTFKRPVTVCGEKHKLNRSGSSLSLKDLTFEIRVGLHLSITRKSFARTSTAQRVVLPFR